MTVDTRIRDLVETAARSHSIPQLLDAAEIGRNAGRRSRRRRVLGGTAAILILGLVVIGGGLFARPDSPSAVFAGQVEDGTFVPGPAVYVDDRYVALAAVSPFEFDAYRNATSVVVESPDGLSWRLVDDAPVIEATGLAITAHEGIVHIVGSRGLNAGTDDSDIQIRQELVHVTSTDLANFTEKAYPVPESLWPAGQRILPSDVAVAGDSLVILATRTPESWVADSEFEELGYDRDSICEMYGTPNSRTVRVCGTTESIDVPRQNVRSFIIEHLVLRVDEAGLALVELKVPSGARARLDPWASLYQDGDIVGIAGAQVFETINGIDWGLVEAIGPYGAMVAARGEEQVFKSPRHIARFGPDDPIKGMGYSSDGGTTWQDIDITALFDGADTSPTFYSTLHASEAGWAMVVTRSAPFDPQAVGVERDTVGPSDFTITSAGYVLEGYTPYGAAVLRDPDEVVVREWDQLEVANPIWSGLRIVNGDVIVVDGDTDNEIVTFTADQWAAVANPHDPMVFEVLFSADGREWSIIDRSTASTRITAMSPTGILVQRYAIGNFSLTGPRVDVIDVPASQD